MSLIASRPLLVVLTLALAASPAARGQQVPTGDDPFDKERARGLREWRQSPPQELRQAHRDAARTAYSIRLQTVRAGVDTPDVVLDDLVRLLDADLALAKTSAERLAARERYWAGVREVEELILERVEAGIKQFTRADYWAARGERLLAESRLSQERDDIRKPLPGTLRSAFDDPNPLAPGPAARAEFEAMRSTPGTLSQATREASSREYEARTRTRMTDSPPVPVVASFPRIAAERTTGRDAAEALASLERLWLLTWKDEQVTWEQVEAGIKEISPADYYDARDARLETSIAIAAARRQPDKPLPLKGGLQDPFAAKRDAPLDTKDVARAKFEATRADVGELNQQRRETLLTAYALRIRRFKTWRDTPDVISAVSRRLLDAELALAGAKAERLAALERQWARAAEIEGLVRERIKPSLKHFPPSAFPPAEFWEARYDRILAELLIAEARAAKE
jgi:hypothetical protein